MPFDHDIPQANAYPDKHAGLREELLALLSDPKSPVVAFPHKAPHRLRHLRVTPNDAELIPAPQDIRTRNMVRLVVDKKRQDRKSLVMSLGGTVLGAIAIGILVGSAIAFDGVSAFGSHISVEYPASA